MTAARISVEGKRTKTDSSAEEISLLFGFVKKDVLDYHHSTDIGN